MTDFHTPQGDLISPSQIEVWRDCPRKWAFTYIAGIRSDSTPAAEKGTAVHLVLEDWLKVGVTIDLNATVEIDGKPFKPGPIAAAFIKHLPHPGTCGTERHVFVRTPVAHYHGYIDWDQVKIEIPVVGDHKTTSNFKWAKTPEDLKKDPAATIYGGAVMAETGADAVDLQWTYGKTTGKPTTKVVRLRLYRSEIERNFDDLDATAVEILAAKEAGLEPLQHDFNPNACDMYGGCPHRDTCNLNPTERLKAIMAKQTLAEKMAARKASLAAGQPGGTPAPAAAPAPVAAAAAPGTPVMGINAPEGAQAPAPAAAAPAAAPEAATVAALAATAPPATAAKKRPGRPPKKAAGNGAPVSPIVGHGTRVKTAPAAAPVAAPAAQEGPIKTVDLGSYALFIDCIVHKGGLIAHTAEIVQPIAAEVAAAHGVSDYRLIEYNKGPAYLREAVDRRLTAQPMTGIGLVLDTRTDIGKDTLETFSKHAGMIVRAF